MVLKHKKRRRRKTRYLNIMRRQKGGYMKKWQREWYKKNYRAVPKYKHVNWGRDPSIKYSTAEKKAFQKYAGKNIVDDRGWKKNAKYKKIYGPTLKPDGSNVMEVMKWEAKTCKLRTCVHTWKH